MIRKEFTMKIPSRRFALSRPGPRRHHVFAFSLGAAYFCVSLAGGRASAAEYYVSPTGSDSNPGTQASPFATLQKANNSAAAGDTIWMRAGTYSITSQLTLSKSGTSDTNRTKIWAYAGEVPILDISNYGAASSGSDVPAVLVTGSWMHLKGLEIANAKVGSSGSHSYSMLRTKNASNNTFELLNIHNGFGPGLTGGNNWYNNTSYQNGTQFNMLASSFDSAGNVTGTITLTGTEGARHEEQHRLSQRQYQHGRGRHREQHLGLEHYASSRRFCQRVGHRLHRSARGRWQHTSGLYVHAFDCW